MIMNDNFPFVQFVQFYIFKSDSVQMVVCKDNNTNIHKESGSQIAMNNISRIQKMCTPFDLEELLTHLSLSVVFRCDSISL